jgi:2-hydroxychromene-2-carboxylate isomerase
MAPTLEFFFDYGSPYSYLANHQIAGVAERGSADLVHRPMLLGGVFKATGNKSPAFEPVEAKRAYGGVALKRAARACGAAFKGNPHFPINTLQLMRTAVAAQQEGAFETFHRVVYPAFWVDGQNLGEPEVVAKLLDAAGLDAARLLELASQDAAKAGLRANTEEAVERGVFGAPTFFLSRGASDTEAAEMYFGADHLPFLEQALADS